MIPRAMKMMLAMLLLAGSWAKADEILPLELVKWLPVEGPANIQPSGLTIRGSSLFTVSDRHDATIFKIKIEKEAAILTPAVVFQDAPALSGGRLDFEGITFDEEGDFYLASEARCRVLRVGPTGSRAAWITPSLKEYGQARGLFRVENAYLEGIASVGEGRFVLCAERQPRGIIELSLGEALSVKAYQRDESKFHFPKGRSPDFSGLFRDAGGLYVLERGAYLICRMRPGDKGFEEGSAWSYQSIVTSPELRYASMRFGRAEGLCMDDDLVYVILDNNGQAREASPNDRRPILLIMKRPKPDEKPSCE
ncbi:MAG: esterase-like activity of phytase family protein [Desulfohalobiaceae bacterium]|nr:esterase-like activity of phytase family protein [Desulfohalobiaceae bacterium]